MTATEELRRMLDERGVPWKDYGYENHTWWGEWHAENRSSVNGLFLKVEGIVTPAQAIAATLGSGTCHNKGNRFDAWACSECGATLLLMFSDYDEPSYSVDGTADVPRYCPNCGRRIEVDDG